MSEKRNVPELRFPEFSTDPTVGKIKKHFFRDIFVFSTGKNIKQNEASPDFETPCVRYGELYHMYREVITMVVNRTNVDKSELHFSNGDEILLPSAGEDPLDIGSASALTVRNVAIGRTINILQPKEASVYSPIFVSYYINQRLKVKISSLAKGVSISNVYNSDLKTLEIFLPSLPEQQKIAEFLTTVDKRIELLQAKKEKLEAYKKGVMQQIFSQKLRFKADDGSDFPVWEERKVSERFEIKRGLVLSVDKMRQAPDKEYKFPVYSSQTKNRGLTGFFNKKLYNDAITWTTDGANAGEVNFRNGEFYCTNVCGVLISDKGDATECMAELLNTVTKKYVSYVGNPKLMNNTMGDIKIKFPSPEEQKKISQFLTSLDSTIDNLNQQIKQTQTWKKGLLQKMFV